MITRFLERLEARFGRHRGISNLMTIIVLGTSFVYIADLMLPTLMGGASLSSYLMFNRALILQGQVWRLITFIFVPLESHLLLLIISLYFDWIMGQHLQNEWGTLRFTLFYAVGMLAAIISGFLTGYTTSYYLNTSLMLAVAILHPNMPIHLYGIIEVRLKWLALLSLALIVVPLLGGVSWAEAGAVIAALLNLIMFFIDHMIALGRNAYRRYMWKKNWRGGWKR